MGYPLTFGMPVYSEFLTLNKKNSIMLSNPKGNFLGYHGMVIFGWDDDMGWHVRNSWGEDWGDNGNCWIPYDYPLREVWLLMDKLVPIEKSRRYNRTIKKIVIHHMGDGQDRSLRDFSAAYMVANAHGSCGMFCRNERVDNIHPDAKKAKKLIIIGGPKYYDHPNVTNLCGEGAPETQIEAAKYVQSLRK